MFYFVNKGRFVINKHNYVIDFWYVHEGRIRTWVQWMAKKVGLPDLSQEDVYFSI